VSYVTYDMVTWEECGDMGVPLDTRVTRYDVKDVKETCAVQTVLWRRDGDMHPISIQSAQKGHPIYKLLNVF
jgi:hypothetical protein